MAMGLPVMVEQNAWTLPQERYNAEWVREQGVGLVLKSFREIAGAVKELLQPENYARYRAAAMAQNNRAVFEIPDMLAGIMGETETENPEKSQVVAGS
jgi:1,2-diacylglycerol 3-beta-galactosyltransferase